MEGRGFCTGRDSQSTLFKSELLPLYIPNFSSMEFDCEGDLFAQLSDKLDSLPCISQVFELSDFFGACRLFIFVYEPVEIYVVGLCL